jgi:hypothetical protein
MCYAYTNVAEVFNAGGRGGRFWLSRFIMDGTSSRRSSVIDQVISCFYTCLGRVGLTTTCPNARAAKLTEDELSPVKVDSSKEREQVYSLTSQYGSS